MEASIVSVDVGLGFYLIIFKSRMDYLRVHTGGPWIIQDHYLTLRKWHSDFKVEMTVAIKTAVWVCFPLLRIKFYDEQRLITFAKMLGNQSEEDTPGFASKWI